MTNTFRRSVVDSVPFEPVLDLETLVSNLAFFESSDPRDTIYALLNIATESKFAPDPDFDGIKPPKPDYDRDILEVYTDFLEWVVHSTKSLDIICRYWAIPERTVAGGRKNPTPLITLPSWIQTITKSPWGLQNQGFNGRINGDSIIGKAGRRRYNAAHWTVPDVQFGTRWRFPEGRELARIQSAPPLFGITGEREAQGDMGSRGKVPVANTTENKWGPERKDTQSHKLRVKGMVIDSVNWTCGPITRGVIPKECLEKGGWTIVGKELIRVPDKLWRTIVADRTAEGGNCPPWYHRAALYCMAYTDNNGHIDPRELLEHGNTPNAKLPYILMEYLKRVQAVTWNRKFIEGKNKTRSSERLFGIAPPETEKNDLICILFGCSVPCILRPNSDSCGNKWYEFIGEAYIHGIMEGEAIAVLSPEEVKTKTKEFIII